METLNLSGRTEPEDNFFQRLFWPTVRNQYDVDLIGRRGFWVALGVGMLSAIVLAVQMHPLLALFTLLVFLLGAAGIRQRSLAAAILVFTLYFTSVLLQWIFALLGLASTGSPLVSLVCMALLLACIRATTRSRQFLVQGDVEFPESGSGALDALVDRFPKAAWPAGKVPFFILAGCYLLLTIAGAGIMLSHRGAPESGMSNARPVTNLPVR